MPRAKKTTPKKKAAPKKKAVKKAAERRKKAVSRKPDRRKGNIVGNFRGKEDSFFKKVRDGFRNLLSQPK